MLVGALVVGLHHVIVGLQHFTRFSGLVGLAVLGLSRSLPATCREKVV